MKFTKGLLTSKIFLLGLLIRFLVMPFTAHFDLRGINFAVFQLPFNHVLNIYEVAKSGPVDYIVNVNFSREYFIYPPLTYFTLGSFMWLLKPFYGGEFVNWIQGYGNDIMSVLTNPQVFRYLFLMKLPYLVFDVLALWGLLKFVSSESARNKVIVYWWLNPIIIFLPYVWGQFDIIPTAISVLAIWLMRKSPVKGALLLGVAASFKNYPLMFLPVVILAVCKDWKEGLKMCIAGIAPFVATTLPFAGHDFFRSTVLFSWQSQKMLDFMWAIGGDDGIYPFVIGYTLIAFWSFYVARKNKDAIGPIVMSLLWYYATTNFHQQWFTWIVPFLVLYAVKLKGFFPMLLWMVVLFFIRLVEIQANVTTELFVWLVPAIDDLPKTRYLIGLAYDIHKVRNIVDSFYVATALWISAWIVKKETVV
jgi:hypothetical protein